MGSKSSSARTPVAGMIAMVGQRTSPRATHGPWRAACRAAAATIAAFLVAPPATGIQIIGFDPAVNDRFSGGFPVTPVANEDAVFVGLPYDLTGIGWSADDPTKGFGFFTPQHFLATVHYGGVGTGGSISLLDGAGSLYTVTQASITPSGYGFTNNDKQAPDISVGTLTQPIAVSRGVPRYGVLDLNASSTVDSSYNGQTLLVYGRGPDGTQSPRIGTATVAATATTGSDIFIQSNASSVVLQSGDSGSPDFIPWTNPAGQAELTIIGNNAATDFATTNVFNMLGNSEVINAINGITTPAGFALRIVGPPSNTWEGTRSNSITARNAWQNVPVPVDDYVLFSGTTAGNGRTVAVNSSANLRGLYFEPTGSGTLGFTFSGSGTLTVGRGGITNYDTSRQTVSAALALGSHQYWNVGAGGVTAAAIHTGTGFLLEIAGSGSTVVTGAITGSGAVSVSGPGAVLLQAASSYTGATRVFGGFLALGAGAGIAASPLVMIEEDAGFDVTALDTYAAPAGQTLAGSGTVLGSVVFGAGATLAPGREAAAAVVTGGGLVAAVMAVPEPAALAQGLVGLGLLVIAAGRAASAGRGGAATTRSRTASPEVRRCRIQAVPGIVVLAGVETTLRRAPKARDVRVTEFAPATRK